MPFTSLAQLRSDDVRIIGKAVAHHWASMPEMIKVLLRQLEDQAYGFPVNQLEHSLQTATRALRAGASEELTVAALCHDIGKAISVVNHGGIGTEILKPYVSHETYEIIRTHETFQARYYNAATGRDQNVTHNTLTGRGTIWSADSRTNGIRPPLIPITIPFHLNTSSR